MTDADKHSGTTQLNEQLQLQVINVSMSASV